MMSLRLGAMALLFMVPTLAGAACQMEATGAKCVDATVYGETSSLQVGEVIPDGSNMLFNPEYYGLPPVSGYWRYYRIEGQVYEVHPETMEVLNIVTAGNSVIR